MKAVEDINAIRKRLHEMGVRTFTGELYPEPRKCKLRMGEPVQSCWCRQLDGSYVPCPPRED